MGAQRGAVAASEPDHDRDERGGHAELGERGAEGRAGDAQVRAVHQGEVEDDVGREADQRDDERGAGVLQAAQDAGGGEVEQDGRHRERADPQVDGGGRVHPPARAEPAGQFGREHEQRQAGGQAEDEGQPHPVDADGEGAAMIGRAEPAGDGPGGAVGQEDEDAGDGRERGGGDAERGQLDGAEMADDDRVGEQEDRLGDEGRERGYGEPQDLAVQPGVRSQTGSQPGQQARPHAGPHRGFLSSTPGGEG